MGDGSSDLPVMMHVNQHDGLTIAVSEAKFITRVARRTVLSDNAMSVLVPVLEEVLRWDSVKIRRFFSGQWPHASRVGQDPHRHAHDSGFDRSDFHQCRNRTLKLVRRPQKLYSNLWLASAGPLLPQPILSPICNFVLA